MKELTLLDPTQTRNREHRHASLHSSVEGPWPTERLAGKAVGGPGPLARFPPRSHSSLALRPCPAPPLLLCGISHRMRQSSESQ
jgi:hypothetical protein